MTAPTTSEIWGANVSSGTEIIVEVSCISLIGGIVQFNVLSKSTLQVQETNFRPVNNGGGNNMNTHQQVHPRF
jgi:hypothetical protein